MLTTRFLPCYSLPVFISIARPTEKTTPKISPRPSSLCLYNSLHERPRRTPPGRREPPRPCYAQVCTLDAGTANEPVIRAAIAGHAAQRCSVVAIDFPVGCTRRAVSLQLCDAGPLLPQTAPGFYA